MVSGIGNVRSKACRSSIGTKRDCSTVITPTSRKVSDPRMLYARRWRVSKIGQPISVFQACSSSVSWRPTR